MRTRLVASLRTFFKASSFPFLLYYICAWHAHHRCPVRSLGAFTVRVPTSPPTITAAELRTQLYNSGGLWNTDMHVIINCGEGDPRFRLAYMPMRNRVEVPRLVLEEAMCPYELEIIGFQRWPEFKTKFPHGKVPVLYNFDGEGHDLAQETAITQFLARKLGLAGKTDEQEALLNMLYQQLWCTIRNNGVTHDGEFYSAPVLRDAAREGLTGRQGPSFKDMHRVNNNSVAERSLAALGLFEDHLVASGADFLGGDSPSYVDLALFNNLFELAEEDRVPDFAERFHLPMLGALLQRIEERPQIKAYLQSSSRIPRYSRPTGAPGSAARMVSGYDYCPGKYSPRPEGLPIVSQYA